MAHKSGRWCLKSENILKCDKICVHSVVPTWVESHDGPFLGHASSDEHSRPATGQRAVGAVHAESELLQHDLEFTILMYWGGLQYHTVKNYLLVCRFKIVFFLHLFFVFAI